jgi:hypothetical protein
LAPTNYYQSNDSYLSQSLHQDRNQSALVVRQEVDQCVVEEEAGVEHHEDEVGLVVTVVVADSVEGEARQEEEDLEPEAVEEDLAEVRREEEDLVPRVVDSAVVEGVELLFRRKFTQGV